MTGWTFRLILAGLDTDDDERMDALYEAGCDDTTFTEDAYGVSAVFQRSAATPEAAVLSAVRDVESAGTGVRVVRVENEPQWLTAAEIAERTGRSRQSISQLATGRRGPGDFPPPVLRRGARSPLWSWDEVRAWFARFDPDTVQPLVDRPSADFLAAVNDRLDLRERRRRTPDAEWWADLGAVLPLVS